MAPVFGGTGGAAFPAIDCPAGQVATLTRIRDGGTGIGAFGLGCLTPTAGYM